MRFLLTSLVLVLLSTAVAAAPEKEKTLRGSAVPLNTAPWAPYRIEGAWRSVDGPIELVGVAFATRTEGEKLFVADAPDGEPKRKVRSGGTLKFVLADGKKKRTIKLRFVRSAEGAWRYHAGEAVRFKLGRGIIALIDANANGVHGEFGIDGILIEKTIHAIPLQQKMLIGLLDAKLHDIPPDGSSLRMEYELIPGTRPQRAALAFLNYLRRAHGLSPVRLDPKLSRGCTEHAEYLTANAWNGSQDPHEQDPKRPGASEEGHAAAGVSVIVKRPPIAALRANYVTWYHRFGLMHPRLTHVGINATSPMISVIDVWRGRAKGDEGAALHNRPWFCPADGVIGLPPGSGPEMPREPVPNLGSRGFPLMVYFPEAGGPITEFKGELFTGKSGKRKVATLLVKPDKKGIAGVVPTKRLESKNWYTVRFAWTRGEKKHTHVIRFRTA